MKITKPSLFFFPCSELEIILEAINQIQMHLMELQLYKPVLIPFNLTLSECTVLMF